MNDAEPSLELLPELLPGFKYLEMNNGQKKKLIAELNNVSKDYSLADETALLHLKSLLNLDSLLIAKELLAALCIYVYDEVGRELIKPPKKELTFVIIKEVARRLGLSPLLVSELNSIQRDKVRGDDNFKGFGEGHREG